MVSEVRKSPGWGASSPLLLLVGLTLIGGGCGSAARQSGSSPAPAPAPLPVAERPSAEPAPAPDTVGELEVRPALAGPEVAPEPARTEAPDHAAGPPLPPVAETQAGGACSDTVLGQTAVPPDTTGTSALPEPGPDASALVEIPPVAPPVPTTPAPPPASPAAQQCLEQRAQPFLVRSSYLRQPELHQRSLRYRAEQYGYFPGVGLPRTGRPAPGEQAQTVTFMGLKVRLHRRIVPALRCVEQELLRTCAATGYKPTRLNGLRFKNTFRSREVSNHVFGIAIDIDSHLNPCCGCGGDLPNHPGCRKKVSSTAEKMKMPVCWVEVFERFGFYWLGHDRLQDTMHFEFLGDPEQILGPQTVAATPQQAARSSASSEQETPGKAPTGE